jgi:hypothetical protein
VTDVNVDPNNSSLSVDSITSDLNGTSVTCADGNDNPIGSRDICVIDVNVLESPEFRSATVSEFADEENMCQLSLEWSEAVVSCSGDVTYTVTATPYLSLSEISTTDTQLNTSVNGNICLVHNITVTTEICEGRIVENISLSLNLTAKSIGSVSSYYYSVHNIMTQAIEAVNVTWPRFRVLSDETVYKLIIDDEEVVSDVSEENCGREMCG